MRMAGEGVQDAMGLLTGTYSCFIPCRFGIDSNLMFSMCSWNQTAEPELRSQPTQHSQRANKLSDRPLARPHILYTPHARSTICLVSPHVCESEIWAHHFKKCQVLNRCLCSAHRFCWIPSMETNTVKFFFLNACVQTANAKHEINSPFITSSLPDL